MKISHCPSQSSESEQTLATPKQAQYRINKVVHQHRVTPSWLRHSNLITPALSESSKREDFNTLATPNLVKFKIETPEKSSDHKKTSRKRRGFKSSEVRESSLGVLKVPTMKLSPKPSFARVIPRSPSRQVLALQIKLIRAFAQGTTDTLCL